MLGHTYVQVTIPQVAQEYGKYYKAIDFFDQLVKHYPMGRKSYRSWMCIFYWLMNTAVVNSYILLKDASTAACKKKYGQIDFRA